MKGVCARACLYVCVCVGGGKMHVCVHVLTRQATCVEEALPNFSKAAGMLLIANIGCNGPGLWATYLKIHVQGRAEALRPAK